MDDEGRVASLAEVEAADTTFLFRVRDVETDEEREAILLAEDEGVVGWLNYCQHFTDVALDKGSGASMRDGEIVCVNHGAYFEADTGLCTFGPCEGAYLAAVEVAVEAGGVYLTDDRYEFVGPGPIPADGLDLSSDSNVEF